MKFLVVLALVSAVRGTIVGYNAPILAHTIPAAVSHQSRIDHHSSPAIITPVVSAWTPAISHGLVPAVSAHGWSPAISSHSWSPSIWSGHQGLLGHHGLGHLLKKRSLLYAAPIATVAHAVVSPAVSHQSRYDITTTAGHLPLAHSGIWASPIGHGLGHSWAPSLGHSWGLGLGHLLKKRSLVAPIIGHSSLISPLIGHSVVASPIIGHTSSISKQSLVQTHPSPIHTVLAHSTPILAHSSPILAHSSPILAHSSPILAHSSPILAHSSPILGHSSSWSHGGLGHLGLW